MNWTNWIARWISPKLREQDIGEAKSKRYYPKALFQYGDPHEVIKHIEYWIKHAGWRIKEKPPIDSTFFKRFSTTLPGTIWLSHGFSKKSDISRASVLSHEYVHFLQWIHMDHDPNVFLKFYATPRGGWICEVQAARFQMAMLKRLDPTMTHSEATSVAIRKAKGLWSNYPNIKLLKFHQVMSTTPDIIMLGWYEMRSLQASKRVPRRIGRRRAGPDGLSEI